MGECRSVDRTVRMELLYCTVRMEFQAVEVPYIDQSEVDTLDATSFESSVTVRFAYNIFLMRNSGKRGGGAADPSDPQKHLSHTTHAVKKLPETTDL